MLGVFCFMANLAVLNVLYLLFEDIWDSVYGLLSFLKISWLNGHAPNFPVFLVMRLFNIFVQCFKQ